MGIEQGDLLTEKARQVWEKRLREDMSDEVFARLAEQTELSKWVKMATDPERAKGTVNFIAQDAAGNICTGVSTSGWAWKYPGRLGDSPVIGAGNYADNRYGAAACTGMGEMAIRASTARSVVLYLKMGLSLDEACRQAMVDLDDLGGHYLSRMSFIALDREGHHAAFSNAEDATYVYMTGDMDAPHKTPRTHVSIKQRWGRDD